MTLLPLAIVLAAGCYLAGSIPFGYLVARAKGVDIRTVGSGNIGATNVGRILGRKWGILCFALDVAKGLVPTLLAGWLLRTAPDAANATRFYFAWLLAGLCCVLGHNYPVFLAFRGGKGVATSLGVVLGVYPVLTYAGLLAFAVWIMVTMVSRYVSAGSIAAALCLPVFAILVLRSQHRTEWSSHWPVIAFAALAAALVVFRHRGNIARLRAGTERRIGAPR